MEKKTNGSSFPDWLMAENAECCIYDGHFTVFAPSGYPLYKILGRVIVWPGTPSAVYLYDPPQEIRQLSHGPCLQLLKPGSRWFKLHWEKPAYNFDDSLAYVENLLCQIPHRILHELNGHTVRPAISSPIHPLARLIRQLFE